MNLPIRINLSRIIILILASFVVLFTVATAAFSQDATPVPDASSAGLNFPVEALGDCKDLGSCTDYCNDPVNQNACISFAKENGFYKDDQTTYATDKLIETAKEELGCDSKDACVNYCADPSHHEACDAWAKRNEIPGGYTDQPDKKEYLETAKEVLGCDSVESCSTFCDNQANTGKCSEFADQVGLIGGTVKEGPGGCQTSETCSAFCSDPANFEQCKADSGGNFAGPGGCNSPESCRTQCEKNPEQCRSYSSGSNGAYVPITCGKDKVYGPGGACTDLTNMQTAVACMGGQKYWDGTACHNEPPTGITQLVPSAHFEARSEMGGCTSPGECYDYCKENQVNGASVCAGFSNDSQRPTDEYTPYLYYTPGTEVKFEPVEAMGGCDSPAGCYDFCKDNPDKCKGFDSKSPRPPEILIPSTYYTPPTDIAYVTPPVTGFYTTPVYLTPPEGSTYTTPQYYTPGMYSTPAYQTPPAGSNYPTPTYYTPWARYSTPTGEYPTPTYSTPSYYTPPAGSNYTTPYYYTPPQYTTPYYYTPGQGGISSGYTTPTYITPPPYTTPQYYTPYAGGGYTTPVYFTPPTYTTPTYYTPPAGSSYTSPSYYTPPVNYTTPNYYTPGTYPTPPTYTSPAAYTSPVTPAVCPPAGCGQYYTPSSYTTPQYYTPTQYSTPTYYTPYSTPTYSTPPAGSSYTSPSYYTPYTTPNYNTPTYFTPTYYTPGGTYTSPYYTPGSGYTSPTSSYATPSGSYYVSPSYSYPTPGGSDKSPVYSYPTPGSGYTYPTPNTYYYPTPSTSYVTPGSYPYPTPSYPTPASSYGTPPYSQSAYSYSQGTYAYSQAAYAYSQASYPYSESAYAYSQASYPYSESAYAYSQAAYQGDAGSKGSVAGAFTTNFGQILKNVWNSILDK